MIQLFVSGISLGSVYALIAVGFAIVFSVLKFSNFAHGGMISACAFIGFFFQETFQTPFYVTVLVTAVVGMLMALLIDTLGYRRIRKKKAPTLYYFLSSITFAIMIEQILSVYFGNNLHAFPPIFNETTFSVGSLRFSSVDTLIFGVSMVLIVVLILVIEKTKVGLAIRAVAINSDTARLMGINSSVIVTAIFVTAGILAGISGVLLGLKYSVYPTLGQQFMTKGFIASVIGGLGSLGGAIAAAFGLGIVEIFLTYYVGSVTTPIILFGIMLLFLFIRPEGISGRFAKDKV